MITLQSMLDCGVAAFLCLILGFFGSIGAIVGLVVLLTPSRRHVWRVGGAALALGLLALGGGFVGEQLGRRKTNETLARESFNRDLAERIRRVGYEESAQCRAIGNTVSALPLVLGALVLVIGLRIAEREQQGNLTRAGKG